MEWMSCAATYLDDTLLKGKNKPVAVFTPIHLPQRMNPIKTGFIIWRTLPILIIDVAEAEDNLIVDNYNYIMDYLFFTGKD